MIGRRTFLDLAAAAAAVAPRGGLSARTQTRRDAADLAADLAAGRTTAADLVEQALARAAAVNPRLNAIASLAPPRARALAGTPGKGPLAGLPTFVKGLAEEEGQPWTEGSRAYAGRIGRTDNAAVTALRRAGLIPLGRSAVPEFGLLPTTEPLLGGPTRNPWNPEHSVGGSSGGAAALVASGVVAIAHASDGGGSIRIPASMCGLVGLKPSRARMQGEERASGVLAFGVNGCLSRTVRDTALFLAALESHSGPLAPVGLVMGPTGHRLRVGVRAAGALGQAPDADVGAVFAETTALLGRLGHHPVETPVPFAGAEVAGAFELLWGAAAGRDIEAAGRYLGRAPTAADVEPATLGFASLAAGAKPADFEAAAARLAAMASAYLAQFDAFDVLVTPVLAEAPPKLGTLAPGLPFDDLRQRLLAVVGYTPIENAVGNPAIALPLGLSRAGLPIGMQFTARPGGERLLLALAYQIEAARPWAHLRPAVWAG
jgi:amidase